MICDSCQGQDSTTGKIREEEEEAKWKSLDFIIK